MNSGKPNEIDDIDGRVFIGNDAGARNLHKLKRIGITHIINCAGELRNYHPSDFHYLSLDLQDRNDDIMRYLERTYRYILYALKSNPKNKVLIHCFAGVSRSASIATYYLMRKNKIPFSSALQILRGKRQIVSPNQFYTRQLQDVQHLIFI